MPIRGAHIELGIYAHTRGTTEGGDAYKGVLRGRKSKEAMLYGEASGCGTGAHS
jgi:hypothetical protein